MVTWHILAVVVLLMIVLFRGLLVSARVLPATCRECGLEFERRRLGDRVCTCHTAG